MTVTPKTSPKVEKLPDAEYEKIWQTAKFAAAKTVKDWRENHGEDFYCGFAWAWFPDARHPFVKYLKRAHPQDISPGYPKGAQVWDPAKVFSQSMYLKEIGAEAFVKSLAKAGITCYAQSRGD